MFSNRRLFNDGWSMRSKVTAFQELGGSNANAWNDVTLPHDALLTLDRDPHIKGGETSGYFPGGTFEYKRVIPEVQAETDFVQFVEFDGVYRDANVYVNGTLAGQNAFGYSRFIVRIDPFLVTGVSNEIKVDCKSHLDSRWYTGAGIYRDVHLITKPLTHIKVDGVRVTTPHIEESQATVSVAVTVANLSARTKTTRLNSTIRNSLGETVGHVTSPVTLLPGEEQVARLTAYVHNPMLWSVDNPLMYTAVVELYEGESLEDQESVPFGIRSLQLDPSNGLRINGAPVKLRGACLHGDNGALGAAAIGRAEERKIELLKEAGFNAIRSSHHPASPALLDACDRLGMLVMDETFDMWTSSKSDFDYSFNFPKWWEQDVEAIVAKNFNHPSVIFYSIGNEIPEAGNKHGARLGRLQAERIRELDPTRFVTNGINGFVAVLDSVLEGMRARRQEAAGAPSGGVNQMMNSFGAMMDSIQASPMVSAATEESFAVLDVAGMNYGAARYEQDNTDFPNRMIIGTETWPDTIDKNWELVTRFPHVLGDFTWTGMDYLGENGIGVLKYKGEPGATTSGFVTPYPGLTAFSGDLDLTGHRRTISYYREVVFGLRTEPYIAVQRPERYNSEIAMATPWSWSDTISNWSWPSYEGKPIRIEVYSDADEIELLLNESTIARSTVGQNKAYRADFDVTYEPGTLTAVALKDGIEVGRSSISSASSRIQISANADRTTIQATARDLAFIDIALTDENGILHNVERAVTVEVTGDGILQGLGSGHHTSAEPFNSTMRTTLDGRALAIVRPLRAGQIKVTISCEDTQPVEVSLSVE